ncbi:MAG: hypothetical protein ACXWC9_04590 [Pseudobdellovibrionaceae bacterium]
MKKANLKMILMAQLLAASAFAQVDPNALIAKRLLERISSTKVPSDHVLLSPMMDRIRKGDFVGAAEIAQTHPGFLNVTVKQMALKMSTREETIRLPLNDFAASFIGVTRDGLDARELLTGNFYYMADAAKVPAGVPVRSAIAADILQSNNHYQDLENPAIDIGHVLIRVNGQQLIDGANNVMPNPDPAGVLTPRAFMGAHAVAGTNRRPVEYTFREFMCVPIEDWADTKASDIRIGQDIDRFPGGEHAKFQTTCKGCHTQMDSLRGAFAKWDFTGNRIINGKLGNRAGDLNGSTGLAGKMTRNNGVFSGGYIVTDDSFVNNSMGFANNTTFGWRGPASGNGVRDFAAMVANSRRFSQCMVKRAYDAICRTDLNPKQNMAFLSHHSNRFEQGNYNLKQLFKEVAVSQQCMGR